MQTILVSIVSEQTIPNYLFIKEFQNKVDKFLFITTKSMEQKNKTKTISTVANIEEKKIIKVLVSESQLSEVKNILKKTNLPIDANYLVNLTGGTKMMSIAVWDYFKRFKNVSFFYIPINKNIYTQILNDIESLEKPFSYNITLSEYFYIYNIKYNTSNILLTKEQAYDIFKDVKAGNFNLEKFPKKKLKKYQIPHDIAQIHTKWLEEFVYHTIKNTYGLSNEFISTGTIIFDSNLINKYDNYQNDNEIDVAYVYNNNLNIIECKFSFGNEKINISALNNSIYKISSIIKRFGLSAKPYIYTLADLNTLSKGSIVNLERRLLITNVEIVDRNKILELIK